MKTLPAQHLRDRDWADMERQIREAFYAILFKPVLAAMASVNPQGRAAAVQIRNAAEDALREAMASGRVQYQNGIFSGQLSAGISAALRAIGARFDKRSKTYRMDAGAVPAWVKAEATTYQEKARQAHDMLRRILAEMRADLDRAVGAAPLNADETIRRVESGFRDVGAKLALSPKLSEDSHQRLADDYSRNMRLWIKKFSEETIGSLRDTVEKNATEGYRFDSLIAGIKRRYGVATNKAKFLARQETGLFMAKFREERFKEAGVRKYRWSTSHDARVRPAPGTYGTDNHRVLDGRIFEYDHPPVVDPATNRRANPGQDYNCRCVDIPILEATVYA